MRMYFCPSCHSREEADDALHCTGCGADLSALDSKENFIINSDGLLVAYHGKSEEIVLPDSVKDISNSCFDSCTFLKSIVLNDNLNRIGQCAFVDCSSLTKVSFGKGLTLIGPSAFYGCRLAEVTIPSGVTTIGEYAFYDIHELKHIVIEEGCELICDEAFLVTGDGSGLDRTIYLPSTLKELGLRVFSNACGTNHVYTPETEIVKDHFRYDKYPIVLHFIPRADQYEQAMANIISEAKSSDLWWLNMYEQDIKVNQANLKAIHNRISYLNAKLKQYEIDLTSASGLFKASKIKKINRDVDFTKRWLAECNAKADEIRSTLSKLEERKASYTHTDSDYRKYAEEKLLNSRAIKYGNVLGGGYPSISYEEYREALSRIDRPSHNPADDWIEVPIPDVTDM